MQNPRPYWPFDPDCDALTLILAAVLALGALLGIGWLGALAALGLVIVLGFFRDPSRIVPDTPGAVVSPADGKIDRIHINEDPKAGPVGGPVITIFLSVLNVHINRAPYACTVEKVDYRPGKFLNALDPASTEHNEASIIRLDCGGKCKMVVLQIAGVIARRIVCRVRPGDRLDRGQRIGMIRFGSRTQIFLPEGTEVLTEVGRSVKGARDVLAVLPEGLRSE
jgi:phosphatidylserine decarboxylase